MSACTLDRAAVFECPRPPDHTARLRHTTAVHLLESGVEPNVIRAWLGHANVTTTDRYAEITIRTKEAALRTCEPPPEVVGAIPRKPVWRDDPALLNWLGSL